MRKPRLLSQALDKVLNGPEHHMFHVTHLVSGYSCLEMGPVVCRRLNKGTTTVERDHWVTFPTKAVCLPPGEQWTVRGPLQDHMGWKWVWEEETVFLQFLVINAVYFSHTGLFRFSTSKQHVFVWYCHVICPLKKYGNHGRKKVTKDNKLASREMLYWGKRFLVPRK